MLLEGNSIRSTERLTGVHRDTILALLETIGERAMRFWETRMRGLPATDIQCDEIWGFVGCKEKTRQRLGYGEENGDAFCFTSIERDSKLLVAWQLGKRSPVDTVRFCDKLRLATTGRCQVTTDGYGCYTLAVPRAFGTDADFAQLVKIDGNQPGGAAGRYSPPEIIDIRTHVICGQPDEDRICTGQIERSNLTIRMGTRRMAGLTNAFSEKWENHEYALAIFFLYYNFCRVHMTLKTTPALAAGIATQTWSVERLLQETA
jgi:IS1 family transposase